MVVYSTFHISHIVLYHHREHMVEVFKNWMRRAYVVSYPFQFDSHIRHYWNDLELWDKWSQ
jgi:hypothetical protein